ncbi:MAG: DEAD/DEAH box helicase [Planctomycetota bacterium]
MTQAVYGYKSEHASQNERRSPTRSAGKRRRMWRPERQSKHTANEQRNTESVGGAGGFADLGLSRPLLAALERVGFQKPTDIQRELIPPALAGRDCLGQARTGTGKTAAFALPLLQRVQPGHGIQALVLVPTRELAAQVGEHVHMLSPQQTPRTLVVYGGTSIGSNLRELKAGVDIVVGTPGRILDLIQRRALDLRGVKLAVLDEVDRMLDIGFRDDIRRIMAQVARERQTIFVSATITDEIRRLAQGLMRDPVEINVSADNLTVDEVEQDYMSVDTRDKFAALRKFLKRTTPRLAIVFTRTKRGASNVARKLERANVACAEIHGGLAQGRRTRVLNDVRAGRLKVLVATDLASRGLDVANVSHIVNYDIPVEPAIYVHRIGRTARMGNSGHALTLVTPEQGRELTEIERLINRELNRVDASDLVRTRVESARESAAVVEPSAAAPVPQRAARSETISTGDTSNRPRRTLGSRFPRSRRRR